jgi:flavin reductase (DIM6/NTAB) family NADH-FMN oxidoreductase RutF
VSEAGITDEVFLDVMGNLAASVTVVTATHEGRHYGLTVSAFSSVSRMPPMVLVCIDKSSTSLEAIRSSGAFTVNFMAEGKADAAMVFASRSEEKFSQVAHRHAELESAGPWLPEDAMAYFECTTETEVEAGDHWVFIGRVHHGQRIDPAAPLVYCRRQFVPLGLES